MSTVHVRTVLGIVVTVVVHTNPFAMGISRSTVPSVVFEVAAVVVAISAVIWAIWALCVNTSGVSSLEAPARRTVDRKHIPCMWIYVITGVFDRLS